MAFCTKCGNQLSEGQAFCPKCGNKVIHVETEEASVNHSMDERVEDVKVNETASNQQTSNTGYQQQPQPQVVIQQTNAQQTFVTGINPAWPVKSKFVAALLAIFLGGIGIHKFYLGKPGMGILYILFCWTGIPEVVAFIEGIIYLFSNDENFQLKHHVRLN